MFWFDLHFVKSTVTGLFKILTYAVSNQEKFGRPFYIDSRQNENQRDELSPQENTSIRVSTIPRQELFLLILRKYHYQIL